MTNRDTGSSTGLLDSLKQSPATKHLVEQARGLGQAHAGRLSDSLSGRLSSAAQKIEESAANGELPFLADGAKRMAQGQGAMKSALGAATSTITGKAKDLLGSKNGTGGGRGNKSTNIEESIDVGVPVSTAYERWTQYENFSDFMKGVESVEKVSDTETNWRVKVFKSRRTWKATIQEDVPEHRIVWTSEGAKGSTRGVVTFHQLAEDLTRVLVTIEYFPSGFMEKTGNLWRAGGRRVRLDLKNFRRVVMMDTQDQDDQDDHGDQDAQDDRGSQDSQRDGASGRSRRRRPASGGNAASGGSSEGRSRPAAKKASGRAPARKKATGSRSGSARPSAAKKSAQRRSTS